MEKLSFIFLIIIFSCLTQVKAQDDPIAIEAKFLNAELNPSIDPLPSMIIDYNIIHFGLLYPNLSQEIYLVIPHNLDTIPGLRDTLLNTNLFESVELIYKKWVSTTGVLSSKITISPNPAKESIHIDFEKPILSNSQIVLSNFQGKVLRNLKVPQGQNNISINLSGLTQGMYIINYLENGISLGAEKILIE